MLIWCLSQHICVKKKSFYQGLSDLGPFILFLLQAIQDNRESRACKMESYSSCLVGEKYQADHHPLNCFSHMMYMNVIFQENMCLTDASHYKHSKRTIFDHALPEPTVFHPENKQTVRFLIHRSSRKSSLPILLVHFNNWYDHRTFSKQNFRFSWNESGPAD